MVDSTGLPLPLHFAMTHPARALTARQESRLVMYLDQEMLQIQRAYQKRNEAQARVATLALFLALWPPVLEVITSTPMVGTAAALHDTYLLRLTTELTEGIGGYTLHAERDRSVARQLHDVVYWLDVLDQLWSARIRRLAVRLRDLETHARLRLDQDEETLATASIRPADPVQGTHADQMPPFAQTERVRLRDVLGSAQQQLFGWMRDQLGVPRPPELEEEWPSHLNTAPAGYRHDPASADREAFLEDAEDAVRGAEHEAHSARERARTATDAALDAEHVTEAAADAELAADAAHEAEDALAALAASHPSPEQQRYNDVFNTKLDPDEDSASDDSAGKESAEESASPPHKRGRPTLPAHSASVEYWDMHFASAFARTLQNLRDP